MFVVSKILIIGAFIISGCSTMNKAKLMSDNPNEAISEVQKLRENLRENQIDLLAYEQFHDGEQRLEKAVNGYKNDDEKADIIEKLSQAKAYFQEGKKVAEERTVIPIRILAARKETLDNGVRKKRKLTQRLGEIDESLRSKTNDFTKLLTVERLSLFEKDYFELEIESVQNEKLIVFRNIIKNAKEEKALKIAPKTYRDAINDLRAAENMIQQSPRNAENYKQSIVTLDKSSKLLSDVMEKFKSVAKGASEEAALELVYQERKLGLLSERTSSLQKSLTRSQSNLGHVSGQLKSKTNEALNSGNKVLLQNSINHVRKSFSDDEAQVYQQGSSLVIRLKKIDFNPGSSMILSKSMQLLSKVHSVINELHSSTVLVQGHTDSTGKRGNNHILSVKRSESVAEYLKSLNGQYKVSSQGFGESQPIANNETRKGRAMNRRVDIIVNTNRKM